MAHGFKSGGRAAGVPNKKTQAVADMLAELNCCPITGMAKIAMDEATPVPVRAAMFRELANYLYPKRKAVEIAAAEGFEPPKVIVRWVVDAKDAADALEAADAG